MTIYLVWEHNNDDTLMYADNLVGAYVRGKCKEDALGKLHAEVNDFLKWLGNETVDSVEPIIIQENVSSLNIRDADSNVIFHSERQPLTQDEYRQLKSVALKSAKDLLMLYTAIPDKNTSVLPMRTTFYGTAPRTAEEMYIHTKNVNQYYFSEIDVPADNNGDILSCRIRGFEKLEKSDYLSNKVHMGSYDEEWSVRKVLRRFIWHDRIHARAIYRMAIKTFGEGNIPNIFCFDR
jgi:hypothetical protein